MSLPFLIYVESNTSLLIRSSEPLELLQSFQLMKEKVGSNYRLFILIISKNFYKDDLCFVLVDFSVNVLGNSIEHLGRVFNSILV